MIKMNCNDDDGRGFDDGVDDIDADAHDNKTYHHDNDNGSNDNEDDGGGDD